MAEIPKITVIVEQAVSSALREVLQAVMDQHGIRIDQLSARWIDISTPADERALVGQLEITSTTRF